MKFELTEEELKKYKEWADTHECKFRTQPSWAHKPLRYVGDIGGEDEFCFTPTGLGVITKVKCACGAEINLTNYDLW